MLMSGWKSDYYELGEHFLQIEQVEYIEAQLKLFPLEDVTIGDAGEVNNCRVGRLIEDHPQQKPIVVNSEKATKVISLFKSPVALSFFKKYFEKMDSVLTIRRAQFNVLGAGSFVGRHLDTDSNPTYKIAAVLQLGSHFTGGGFLVYENSNSTVTEAQRISPGYGSLTISFCSHEHEVEPVLMGTRTSLVFFINDFDGINPRRA